MTLSEASETDINVLKEVIRQSELKLAAQLQARIALEGKSNSSTSWIVTLLIATLGALSALKGNPDAGHIIDMLLFVAIGLLVAAFANLIATVSSGKWTYSGNSPSFFIDYIRVNEPNYWVERFVNYVSRIRKRPRRLFAVEVSADLKFKNGSIEQVLHQTIIYYAEGISRNEDILRSIKNMSNAPSIVIFITLLLAVIIAPAPVVKSPAQKVLAPASPAAQSP